MTVTSMRFCSLDEGSPSPKRSRTDSLAVQAEGVQAPLRVLAANNAALLADKEAKKTAEEDFIASHANVLRPFLARPKAVDSSALPLELEPLSQPKDIVGDMRDYQLESIAYFVHAFDHGVGFILGDEMGLGKTLQTIAFFSHLRFERQLRGPFLVMCPLTVLESWSSELKRWSPKLKVLKLHSHDDEEREFLKSQLVSLSYDVAITTYDVIKNKHWRHSFSRVVFQAVVADEGHVLKNPEADVTRFARRIRAISKIILTGTPVQNNLGEMHALLEFICPGLFAESRFLEAYDAQTRQVQSDALEDVRRLLEVFMLRRLKADVEKGIPMKCEVRVNCPLSPMQLFWYRRLLVKDWKLLEQIERGDGHGGHYQKLASLVAQLRKACNHPYLFDGAEGKEPDTLGAMVAASGKLALLDRLLVGLRARGHRAVIFSQFTRVLDILQDYMELRGWHFLRLDGSTSRVQRLVGIHQFQKDEKYSFFLMSTRSGGLGINLQSADTVVLFDSDWNPQADRQAMARVHRVGQTKQVWVYRLVCEGTVEERILQRAESKLALDRAMLEGCQPEEVQGAVRALFSIIRSSVTGAATRPLSEEELGKLLDRSMPPKESELGVVDKFDEPLFDMFSVLGKNIPRKPPTSARQIGAEWFTQNGPSQSTCSVRIAQAYSLQPEVKSGRANCLEKADFCLACKSKDVELESCCNPKCNVSLCLQCLPQQRVFFGKYSGRRWACPQHRCNECDRKAEQAGGTMLRCLNCPRAWCETCLPGGLAAVHIVPRAEHRGLPASVLLIQCRDCKRDVEEIHMEPEPSKPLDLSSYEAVGDVDKVFAFLSDVQYMASKGA